MVEATWTEEERLAALRRYEILDTPPEPEFDDAVALVKTICRVPIALVSLVDVGRQWFKARVGTDAQETGIDTSVCALAIQQSGVFTIEDLSRDPRTAHMSLVTDDPKIRFYAGTPLVTSEGLPLGSLCAIDVEPRVGGLHADQAKALEALGRQVVAQIELRSAITDRDRAITAQERRQGRAARDSEILQTMLKAQQRVLQSGGDFDTVLQALVEAALAAVRPAEGVVVEMRDGSNLVYRAASGSAADRIGLRFPISGSFSGRALTEETALVSGDTLDDDRADNSLGKQLGIRSLVVVPMARHGEAVGVLKLHSSIPHVFKSRHILIGQMLAGLIAASFTESAEAAAIAAAEHSEESYRHIVDSAIDSAIISTDENGLITSWSRGAETIMGWTEGEIVGRPLSTIFTPEDNEAGRPAREMRTAQVEGRASDERWHIRKDDTRFYAHGAVTPLLGPGSGFVKSLRDVTDEHATRSALDASRLQLDTALATGLISFFKWDVLAGTVFGDARFAEFFSVDRDKAAAGISLDAAFGAILPADRALIEGEIASIIATCADYSHSYRVHDGISKTRWMLVRGRCVEQDSDRPLVYVGTAVDVTSQREAEERLGLSRERLELATRAAELGSFDYLPQNDQLDWDDRCRALFGLSPGAPVTYENTFLAGLHPDDRDFAAAAVAASLDPAGPGTFDVEYRTIGIEDGIERTILAKGLAFFTDHVPMRLIGTVQDVTADRISRRKLIETERELQALNQSLSVSVTAQTEELDRLWDTSPDLLVVLGFDGTIKRVNPAWTDILGYRPLEMVGYHINDFVVPEDVALTQQALEYAAGAPLPTTENRYRHKDGSTRWMSWVAAPTENEIYATGRHITAAKEAEEALRKAEDQLRQAQKVEAIGQLTGGVAHDFNNLLTVIRGSTDLLRRSDLSNEKRIRYIDAIADTADRATKLTSQLLAFARRSSLQPIVFDVGESIRGIQGMMSTLTGSMIEVAVAIPEAACFINADPSQFDTAIVNMAVNARDAMDRQGRLTITVKVVDCVPAIRSHPAFRGAYVAVSIADSGGGIPADKIEQIFEPFFTTKEVGQGTGLGLSQVFGFAKQSGGEIDVESIVGKGTTFTLYLPATTEAPADEVPTPRTATPSGKGTCILVVEDNADVGDFAANALAELGHFTVFARNGEEALARLKAEAASFDAVFSDVVMPGMSGIELGQHIRRLYPDLPVLLTSGYSSVLAEEGTHGFELLHKPYSLEELSQRIQRVIGERQAIL